MALGTTYCYQQSQVQSRTHAAATNISAMINHLHVLPAAAASILLVSGEFGGA
jgi:hypothetical protein